MVHTQTDHMDFMNQRRVEGREEDYERVLILDSIDRLFLDQINLYFDNICSSLHLQVILSFIYRQQFIVALILYIHSTLGESIEYFC